MLPLAEGKEEQCIRNCRLRHEQRREICASVAWGRRGTDIGENVDGRELGEAGLEFHGFLELPVKFMVEMPHCCTSARPACHLSCHLGHCDAQGGRPDPGGDGSTWPEQGIDVGDPAVSTALQGVPDHRR